MSERDELIADDAVFTATQAAADEARCWSVIDFNGRGAIAARDRKPLIFDSSVDAAQTATFERHDFSDREAAERYIQWRSIKAALLSHDRLEALTAENERLRVAHDALLKRMADLVSLTPPDPVVIDRTAMEGE